MTKPQPTQFIELGSPVQKTEEFPRLRQGGIAWPPNGRRPGIAELRRETPSKRGGFEHLGSILAAASDWHSCRQVNPLMKNTRAHQNHQDLVEGNTPTLIQRFDSVEKIDHL